MIGQPVLYLVHMMICGASQKKLGSRCAKEHAFHNMFEIMLCGWATGSPHSPSLDGSHLQSGSTPLGMRTFGKVTFGEMEGWLPS